jgi:hypothetical protein
LGLVGGDKEKAGWAEAAVIVSILESESLHLLWDMHGALFFHRPPANHYLLRVMVFPTSGWCKWAGEQLARNKAQQRKGGPGRPSAGLKGIAALFSAWAGTQCLATRHCSTSGLFHPCPHWPRP